MYFFIVDLRVRRRGQRSGDGARAAGLAQRGSLSGVTRGGLGCAGLGRGLGQGSAPKAIARQRRSCSWYQTCLRERGGGGGAGGLRDCGAQVWRRWRCGARAAGGALGGARCGALAAGRAQKGAAPHLAIEHKVCTPDSHCKAKTKLYTTPARGGGAQVDRDAVVLIPGTALALLALRNTFGRSVGTHRLASWSVSEVPHEHLASATCARAWARAAISRRGVPRSHTTKTAPHKRFVRAEGRGAVWCCGGGGGAGGGGVAADRHAGLGRGGGGGAGEGGARRRIEMLALRVACETNLAHSRKAERPKVGGRGLGPTGISS